MSEGPSTPRASLGAIHAETLLDTHRRIRASAPLVSVVTARHRRESRAFFSGWVRSRGGRVLVSPRPTVDAAEAAWRAAGASAAVLLVGGELPSTLRAARDLLNGRLGLDVAIAARAADVVAMLLNPQVPVEDLTVLIQGLAPVDPLEQVLIARVIDHRRLRPLLRSPHEGLLYFLLESRAETRGRFDTNQRIEVGGESFEVDLIARSARLVIEIDGPQHEASSQAGRDEVKQRALEAAGYTVRRFTSRDVAHDPVGVWTSVLHALRLPPREL